MPRIEIELTSCRPDGTWTWRAAGARQPKGSLEAAVLPEGAKVGDVLRAEADFELEGILVRSTSVATPKRAEPERLAILGSGKEEPGVTTNLRTDVTGGDRSRRGGRDDRDRPHDGAGAGAGRPGRGRPDQARPRTGTGRGPQAGRPGADAGSRPPRAPSPDRPAGADRADRGDRQERPRHDARSGPAGRPPRDGQREGAGRARSGPDRSAQERSAQERSAQERSGRPARGSGGPGGPGPGGLTGPARPPAKRLQPGRAHRDAVVADLSPEQRVVAEQVLRGGLPAVRQAVEEQNAKARADGGPEIKADAIMAIAEELLPRLRAGEWRDKAEAAAAGVDAISLRDLRAVVTGADVARDDEGRTLAVKLREALERRSAAEQQAWVDEITGSLDEGRVVRALRLSGRPPDPGFRFPADVAARLSDAAGEALTPDTTPDRWAAVLEAVAASPVRRTIKPKGVPAQMGDDLIKAIRLAAPRVPALAGLVPGLIAEDGPAVAARPPRPRGPRPAGRPGSPSSPGGPRPASRPAGATAGAPRPGRPPGLPRAAPPKPPPAAPAAPATPAAGPTAPAGPEADTGPSAPEDGAGPRGVAAEPAEGAPVTDTDTTGPSEDGPVPSPAADDPASEVVERV
jgi:hypothetical protein